MIVHNLLDSTTVRGRRFGVLVHTLLRDIPFQASDQDLKNLAGFHARVMRATASELTEAIQAVRTVLKDDLVAPAGQAVRCLREHPITHRLDGDRLVEGTIDLAYLSSNQWTLIDFKTTAEFEDHLAEYRNQIQWYALALEETTGQRVKPYLLRI